MEAGEEEVVNAGETEYTNDLWVSHLRWNENLFSGLRFDILMIIKTFLTQLSASFL